MPTVPTVPVAPVPVATTPTTKVQPAKLSRTEWWVAALLVVGGIALIVVLLSAFMGRTDEWSLKSKESSETTEATAEAGKKTATTTEYSDSVLITGLGLGALLILTGAFYGRIREITLPGGITMKVDPPPGVTDSIEKKAEEVARSEEGVEKPELAEEAKAQAARLYLQDLVQGPPTQYSENLAERAVSEAVKQLKNRK